MSNERKKRAARSSPSEADEADEVAEETGTYVDCAGLVLASPFLPRLFGRLGLLGGDSSEPDEASPERPGLTDLEGASRAVYLLAYMAFGSGLDEDAGDGVADEPPAESTLSLPKVLAGWPVAEPVDRAFAPSAADRELADSLLATMLGAWPVLGGTSVAGLRETFLQREGRLDRKEGAWRLTVQRKTVDVLVDQVPWSFSVVLHPWMEVPVHVSWG